MSKIRVLDLNFNELKSEFDRLNVDIYGSKVMLPKGSFRIVKIESIASVSANVIKQQMLSNGGDAAVSRSSIDGSKKRTGCIIMGTEKQYQELIKKLRLQPWGLSEVSDKIKESLSRFNSKMSNISLGSSKISFGKRTRIMGIVNITPDSFSNGGKFLNSSSAAEQIYRLVDQGADIIDIGGESSRPGSGNVRTDEELKRVIPVIKRVRKKIKVPISIDTRKSEVARKALESGADIVNDISSFGYDPKMAKVLAEYKVPVILMHMKGTPKTMQRAPEYRDVISEIYEYLEKKISLAAEKGISRDKIIIDPGIGFGKGVEDNIEIIGRLREFRSLGRPVLIGLSRKSFIGGILKKSVDGRLYGSLGSYACAIINGADILRVHDVRETRDLVRVIDRIKR
ncbi:MAG: dihydropteroate synthase [Candidatus Kaelpia imicola]|nr:dihydropteroate synthase [Candidatus Kaelpia imicola]